MVATVLALALLGSAANDPDLRLRQCLLVRHAPGGAEYGMDALDPLIWQQTTYLLSGESHKRVIACLDQFLDEHGETLIREPAKRAMLQRDLWTVFDWAAWPHQGSSAPRLALASRLARAMWRLALTDDEIRRLPDSYADTVAAKTYPVDYDAAHPERPFLPPDLFAADGPWVCLSGRTAEPTAIGHFTGRSRFFAFMRLPGGRQATLDYIRRLRASHEPPMIGMYLNLRLPQFPPGTAVALVRQAMLVDTAGNLVPAPTTESVQLRVYHAVTPGTHFVNHHRGPAAHDQDFYELRLSRGSMKLIAVGKDETEYPVTFTFGTDPFETPHDPFVRSGAILEFCRACHSDSGIHSVQSRLRWMAADDSSFDHATEWETAKTIEKKRQDRNFELLQRDWR